MRWSIIRIIWLRELRDQLRDRRTLFMVAGLPLLLYPILGVAVLQFAVGFADRTTIVGIVGGAGQQEEFPPRPIGNATSDHGPVATGLSPLPPLAWLTAAIPIPGGAGADRLLGAAALEGYGHLCADYPVLIDRGNFVALYLPPMVTCDGLAPLTHWNASNLIIRWIDAAPREMLDSKKVDVLLSTEPDFWAAVERGQPSIVVESRYNDEASRLAVQRLECVLSRWKKHIKEVHFNRRQLPIHIDDPFKLVVQTEGAANMSDGRGALDLLVRIFPFMLVMWSLAGALYPAVDLCAGEKERGTMETLLISPAGREEIVWGKFLTIWVFSTGTALLNILSMGITTWWFGSQLPRLGLTAKGLFGCTVLLLPLAAFFSAICLSIGAYARSSKEGQYYLMPLFLLTMPLIFLTLAPGVELNSFYSMVPVTGVALLMQRTLTAPTFEQPWFYTASVMAPIALYSWLALRWAIDQFQREEVLFREAERIDIHLWVQHIFRDKETRPTTAQALFCFTLLLTLRWMSADWGLHVPLLVRHGITAAAFVAGPPLFMALMLTTRPRQVLGLRWPAWPYLAASVLLMPLAGLAVSQAHRLPRLWSLIVDRQLMVERAFAASPPASWWIKVMVLALVTAAAQEIAFRGFIFAGLLKRMAPWPAILVSSFLFAAFHMNVFLLPPYFILGVGLGLLALRSGSLIPGILLHGSCYAWLQLGPMLIGEAPSSPLAAFQGAGQYVLAAACTLVAASLLWWQNRRRGDGRFAALLAVPHPVIPPPPKASHGGQRQANPMSETPGSKQIQMPKSK
jgi:sodium transport system permease protein